MSPMTPEQRRHRLEATLLKTLWRSEAHRRLAESNIIGVVFADLDGKITGANDEFLRMLGYAREDIDAGTLSSDEFRVQQGSDARANAELLKKGVLSPRESVFRAKNGKAVPVLVGVALLEGSDHKTIGFVLDLTERKEAEEKARGFAAELEKKNAQLEEDLLMAREIQQAFLPQQYPAFPPDQAPEKSALRFFHRYFPAGPVGGDFFDVLPLSDHSALTIICDVMGHGVRAALVTGMIRTLVEQLRVVEDPGKMLSALNRGLIATFRQTGSRMFVSACCCIADLSAGTLRFSNAGHPPPIHLQKSGDAGFLKARSSVGPAMGLLDDAAYASSEVRLSAGDRIMLYTDGLYELEDSGPEPFTQGQLLELVREQGALALPDLFDTLLAEVKQRSVNHRLLDDVCLVGMDVTRLLR